MIGFVNKTSYEKKIKFISPSLKIARNLNIKIKYLICLYTLLKFLLKNKIIYPIYKTSFPGTGAEYHYFGTIPITSNKNKLSVNENCQLKANPNIYIVDGSVFDFRVNKYPLALMVANARRIGNSIK